MVTSVPVITSLSAGRTSHALFGALPPDQVWFVREQLGGGVLVFGPPMGVLRLIGGTAQYELRLGLGSLAWVVGVALFLLSVTVVARGGSAWVVANAGLVLGAVALQVRFERRTVPMLAAEVLRALQQAG